MKSTDKVNILMVDDQPSKLMTYEEILRELGENLIKATSGSEALRQLLLHEVSIVLIDVNMPDMDGFELARLIREHPRYQEIAILFISAVHLTDLDRIRGYQRGAVDYISVPLVPELLRAKVSVFADLHRKTRELESVNRELERRVKELETIMQVLPVGIEVAHDQSCSCVTRNTALDEIQGLAPGASTEEAPALYRHGRPLEYGELPLQRAAYSGLSTEDVELEMHRSDGSIAHIVTSARPLLDRTGEVHGAVAAFHDISARKLMEAALRYRASLLDLAFEAIMTRDLDGRVVFWNSGAESLYGWSRQEACGRVMHSLLATRFPVSEEEIEETLRTNGTWAGKLVQRTREGAEIVVACRSAIDQNGKAVLEIARDITSELRVEEMLRKTEMLAAMGKVAGVVAHEINNPLEALTNTLYLLSRHPSLDDEARNLAAMGEQELGRIARINRQTLGFYRESKEPVRISVTDIVDEVLNFESRMLHMNRITLERRYDGRGSIEGLPGELRQVFLNLIGNAIQAMPEGGRLRIRIGETPASSGGRPRRIRIFITDTGVGIQPDQAKRLFEPFFTTKSMNGTGLGLWISRGIIEKYEGTIAFRSMQVGGENRTSFLVSIPDLDPSRPSRIQAPVPGREQAGEPGSSGPVGHTGPIGSMESTGIRHR